jgi:putative phosphoribosyl transferase
MARTGIFADRSDAGRRLASRLQHLAGPATVILGLPRGGVPVAFEVSQALGAPLDVLLVRKLGVPFQPELAMGAIGEGGVMVLNPDVLSRARVSAAQLAEVEQQERDELARRAAAYHRDRAPIDLSDKVAVIIDDGIATGATARAACQIARARGASRIVMAVPVVSPDAASALAEQADELIYLKTTQWFSSVGEFYRDFHATSDDDVVGLLVE